MAMWPNMSSAASEQHDLAQGLSTLSLSSAPPSSSARCAPPLPSRPSRPYPLTHRPCNHVLSPLRHSAVPEEPIPPVASMAAQPPRHHLESLGIPLAPAEPIDISIAKEGATPSTSGPDSSGQGRGGGGGVVSFDIGGSLTYNSRMSMSFVSDSVLC